MDNDDGYKNRYKQLCNEHERISEIIREKEKFFNNDIPDAEDIDEMLELSYRVPELLELLYETCFDKIELTRIESLLLEKERYEDSKYSREYEDMQTESRKLMRTVAVKKSEYDKIKKTYDERINVHHKDEDAYALFAAGIFCLSTFSVYKLYKQKLMMLIVISSAIVIAGILMLIREIILRYRIRKKHRYEEDLKQRKEEIDSMEKRADRLEHESYFFFDYRRTYRELLKRHNFLTGKIDEFYKIIDKLETYMKRFPEEFTERIVKRYPKNITLSALTDNRGIGPLSDGKAYIKLFLTVRDYREEYLRSKKELADIEKEMMKWQSS